MVFSGIPVSSTNKTDCHDIAEILLKVALSTIIKNKPIICSLQAANEIYCYQALYFITLFSFNHVVDHYYL
jgi:hypothetical protein